MALAHIWGNTVKSGWQRYSAVSGSSTSLFRVGACSVAYLGWPSVPQYPLVSASQVLKLQAQAIKPGPKALLALLQAGLLWMLRF